jgi:hypothetical protein
MLVSDVRMSGWILSASRNVFATSVACVLLPKVNDDLPIFNFARIFWLGLLTTN